MTYQTEPVTMWFDRRIVLRTSPIQGTGTFATEPIRAGETLVWVTGGIVYTPADWAAGKVKLDPEFYNEERLGDNLLIATPKLFQYYINHSCEPNALDLSRSPNVTSYVAWRDIEAEQEVTTDYGVYGGATLDPCSCGAAACRGRVTPEDWKRADLQERYRGYFPRFMDEQVRLTKMPAK